MARRAGALYLVFAIVAIVSETAFPRFLVSGDPAATVRNIVAAERLYRLSILAGFATLMLHLLVVVSLYRLLKAVDAWQAGIMAILVAVGAAVAIANGLHRLVPLVLINNGDALSAFSKPQLDAFVFASLRLHAVGAALVLMFWGLWLFPFGVLVYRSGFLSRVFGVLLIVAGFGYSIMSVTTIALPAYRASIAPFITPLYFGEVPIIFGLLFSRGRHA